MTRIADALRRARTGSSVGSDGGDSHDEGAIQFFAPGQPAVISPWKIDEESLPTSASDQCLPGSLDRAAAIPPAVDVDGPGVDEHAGLRVSDHADKLISSPSLSLLVRAQYNKLAAALHQAQTERDVKAVMLVSHGSAEGKTLTAVNLALTFSEAFQRRVLLVDADLRKPSVHELLGLSNTRGLSDLLDLRQVSPIRVSAHLSVLPAGVYQDDPIKIVTSDRLWSLIQESRIRFDWIVIDTPPLGLVPDARLLAPMTDGALLVAESGRTTSDEVRGVAETFDPTRLLGVVLNRVPERIAAGAPLSDYHYAPSER